MKHVVAGWLLAVTWVWPAMAEMAAIDNVAGKSLVVEIQWDAPVDLDIFLTDPSGETVYFANRLAKSGAAMGAESGCRDAAQGDGPYRESIRIPSALAGRYRVSVDFIKDCGHTTLSADLRVILKTPDGTVLGQAESQVQYRSLNPVAWEFRVQ